MIFYCKYVLTSLFILLFSDKRINQSMNDPKSVIYCKRESLIRNGEIVTGIEATMFI